MPHYLIRTLTAMCITLILALIPRTAHACSPNLPDDYHLLRITGVEIDPISLPDGIIITVLDPTPDDMTVDVLSIENQTDSLIRLSKYPDNVFAGLIPNEVQAWSANDLYRLFFPDLGSEVENGRGFRFPVYQDEVVPDVSGQILILTYEGVHYTVPVRLTAEVSEVVFERRPPTLAETLFPGCFMDLTDYAPIAMLGGIVLTVIVIAPVVLITGLIERRKRKQGK